MPEINLATFDRKLEEGETMIVSLPEGTSPEMKERARRLLHQTFVPFNIDDMRKSMAELGKESVNKERTDEDEERRKRCEDCGGVMSWCESCEIHTQTCCVDYGTCRCS